MSALNLIDSTVTHAVALEVTSDCGAVAYLRTQEGVLQRRLAFRPFLLLKDPALLNGSNTKCDLIRLHGEDPFCWVAAFPDLKEYDDAKTFLRKSTGLTAGSPYAPYLILSDLVQQALIQNRMRLFSGMAFEDVLRMQIDIETLCSPEYDFPNPAREEDAIIIIGLSDSSGWEQVISTKEQLEKEMLEELVRIVRERDPDIIEGHNFFRFDLPYLEARAKHHNVKLTMGRDGSQIKKRNSRFHVAERTINYTRYDIFGRHVADTYHLALFYDAVKRDLDGYGLKTIARHFQVAAPDRVYVDASQINSLWAREPDTLLAYCLDDVRETRAISAILSPSSFYQTQIIPLSYQNCIIRGNATRIDALFLAEYLRAKHSIPTGERARPFSGALTRSFDDGVFDNVMHCDVRSLYPSIILSERWSPVNDSLGIFLRFLESLRSFRLNAKDAAKKAVSDHDKNYYSSLQSTFKILINSFYGYLGFEQGFLNDFDMAERVTARGREILSSMLDFLLSCGCTVIEMDTDGIYFQPPAGTDGSQLDCELAKILPHGIEVDFDEVFPAMFSYKSKNYALLKQNGEVAISGAALKSRGLEPFQREYMHRVISALLHHKNGDILAMHQEFTDKIRTHQFPLDALAKSETLADSLDNYRKKLCTDHPRRSAAYELAIASGREYKQGDQVSFYVTGSKKKVPVVGNSKLLADADEQIRDENVEYYLAKLEELQQKFEPFVDASTDPQNQSAPNLF